MTQQDKTEKYRKFSVGYQLPDDTGADTLMSAIETYRDQISEVFFALPGMSSGRYPMGSRSSLKQDEIAARLAADLDRLQALNIKGVMLLNSSCLCLYSDKDLTEMVLKGMRFAEKHIDVTDLTVMSPSLAMQLRGLFPQKKLRASVNMRLGEIMQFNLLHKLFDGYYLQREYNRRPDHIATLRTWCDNNGKTLHLLANSGCLYLCPFHQFHINMTAHEREIQQYPTSWKGRRSACDVFLNDPDHQHALLQGTWIRPEDLHHLTPYFDTVKLATRCTKQPEHILQAYCEGSWHGSVTDLLEPVHLVEAGLPAISNDAFPADWYSRTTSCKHQCDTCDYCRNVFNAVTH